MADIYDWSTTPATNSSADSAINWAEGMDPDQVNDSARQMMTRVAEVLDDIAPTRSTTGTGNAYAVVTAAVTAGAYNDGEIIACIVDRANTSACTLNSNGRGAVAWRPEVGREFAAGELRANQPIIAFYRSASNEFLAVGSGYHVNAMTSGVLTQSVVGRLLKIGTPVLSLSPTAEAGYIRLTQTTQTLNKADWPELSSFLSSISYPWGSTSTTFNLPPAAGYFLRFAATSTAIDTSGARTAGSTQTDQNKTHTHGASATSTVSDPGHFHAQTVTTDGGLTGPSTGGGFSAYAFDGAQDTGAKTTGITVSTSVTVNNTGSGGDEVRVKNVAFHVDVFASSALATGALAQFGFSYAFDAPTTSSDPGSGNVRLNNATLASVTEIYISETDSWGVDISGFLSTISSGVRLRLSKIGAQASTVLFTASGAPTDNGGWRTIPGAVTVSGGSFTAGDSMALEQFSGAAGPAGSTGNTGPTGAAGVNPALDYTWSTATSGDPGSGKLLVNNATPASATQLNISETNRQSASQAAYIALWDDSTTTTSKGVVRIVDLAAPGTNFLEYKITGAMTDAGGYDTFPVTYVGGAGSITNNTTVAVAFYATGDKGVDGAGAGDVVGPASAVDSNFASYNTTTGKLIKDSGKATPAGAVVGTTDSQTLTNKTLSAPIIASISNTGTLTLPTSTDTLVGRATTDTLTNKTLTSPTLTTPVLGTPSSGTLTNCTGLPVAGGGTGVASTTAYAVLCGGTTSTAALQSIASVGTAGHVLTSNGAGALPTFQAGGGAALAPTRQTFTSGSGTYTTPASVVWLRVRMVGGGGGGGGSGTSPGNGGAGGNTTFSTFTASGSGGASGLAGGSGGTATGGTINTTGGRGADAANSSSVGSGYGGSSLMGPGAGPAVYGGSVGRSATANTGGGGSGATATTGVVAAAGGGAGGYVEGYIEAPSASYSYAIGAGGTAGAAGTSGSAGGVGGSGYIIVEEFY